VSGGTDLSPLDDLKALFEEVQVLCGGLNDDLPDASIEDRFSDEELHTLLTNVLVLVRSTSEPTAADRTRIAGEVRATVDDAVKRRNDAEE
jgi:hypothetical protein